MQYGGVDKWENERGTEKELFIRECERMNLEFIPLSGLNEKIYFKDSLLKAAGINRDALPSNCVNRDFNIFR